MTIEELIEKNSVNVSASQGNKDTLIKIAVAIEELGKQERYSALRLPVIAGGSIRDIFFGLPPNDWDIFFDLSSVDADEGEKEDFVLLYLSDLVDELRKDAALRPRLINTTPEPLVGTYTDDAVREHWEGQKFVVYQTGWNTPDVEWPEHPLFVQTIGRTDKRLTDNPVEFLDSFDYCAVKALFDPTVMDFVLHDEFKTFLDTKEIEYKDNKTYGRIAKFSDRFWPHKNTLKLIDKRPKTEVLTTWEELISKPIAAVPNFPVPNIMDNDWAERVFRDIAPR